MQTAARSHGERVAQWGHVTIAVNPGASRVTSGLIAQVRNEVAGCGYRAHVRRTAGPDELEELARAAGAAGDPLFVVVGGDGSVARAAASLAGSAVPLLVVPAGTGNLLAAALGQPRDPRAALALIRTGHCRTIDLGEAETGTGRRIFTVAAGAGFDARVMAATPDARKRRFGPWAYLLTALGQLASVGNAQMRLTIDGKPLETDAAVVLAANCLDRVLHLLRPRIAIDPTDGRLDVFVVPGRNGIRGLASVARLLNEPVGEPSAGRARHQPTVWQDRGTPSDSPTGPDPGARPIYEPLRLRARELVIDAQPAQPVELDGDALAGVTPVTLRVLPAALRIVTRALT